MKNRKTIQLRNQTRHQVRTFAKNGYFANSKRLHGQMVYQTLTQVNESVVRIGIVEGEYHWHKHDNDDEFFFVLSGQLLIDLEDHTIELNPQQGVTISKGVIHRPRAPKKTVMLMVETSAIQPTGD